jgi:very-short-patch-repair endonuclease
LTLSRDGLREAVERGGDVPGHLKAAWVAAYALATAESPLESLARAVTMLGGFPEPRTQVEIETRLGPFRVDLLDRGGRVVTEADGRSKYSSPRDVWQEKRREDALRDRGLEVIRFTYADYRNPGPWLAAYRRALKRAYG